VPAGLRDGSAERTRTGGWQNSASTILLPSPRAKSAAKPHISGARGVLTLHLRRFARDGVVPLDYLQGVADGKIRLAPDLYKNLAGADQHEADFAKVASGYMATSGMASLEDTLPGRWLCRTARGVISAFDPVCYLRTPDGSADRQQRGFVLRRHVVACVLRCA
jgi:hypothetical protein